MPIVQLLLRATAQLKMKEIFQEDSLFDKTGTNNRIEASPTSRNEGLAKPEI